MLPHLYHFRTRWHAARVVDNKEEATLLDTFYIMWIALSGAPENFHIDGESGLNTDSAKAWIEGQGSKHRLVKTLSSNGPSQTAFVVQIRVFGHIPDKKYIYAGVF